MEAALKLVQKVKDRSSATRKEREAAYSDASKAIDVARKNLDAAVKGDNQGAFDAALQVYKIRSDIFYTAAEKLLAARKAEQEDNKAAEDAIKSSFVDLTADEPDAIEIDDEGIDSGENKGVNEAKSEVEGKGQDGNGSEGAGNAAKATENGEASNTTTSTGTGQPKIILLGTLYYSSDKSARLHMIRGKWTFRRAAGKSAQPFELLRSIPPDEDLTMLPADGEYHGTVVCKRKDVAECGVMIRFTKTEEEGVFAVKGTGLNERYGMFKLVGTAMKSNLWVDPGYFIKLTKAYIAENPPNQQQSMMGGKKRAATTFENEDIDDSCDKNEEAALTRGRVGNIRNKKARDAAVDIYTVKSIKVTGSGFQGANGIYVKQQGTYNWAPHFLHHGRYNGESAFYRLWFFKGHWRISVPTKANLICGALYETEINANPFSEDEWKVVLHSEGINPTPKLEVECLL